MKRFLLVLGILSLVPVTAMTQEKEPHRHALIVGCTKYPNAKIRTLAGPVNDARMIRELLITRYGFPEKNITRLVGWPENEKLRPTYRNITAGFKQLVAKAAPDTQIVILLAGHGMQTPIPPGQDPLDPKNPEPDGMDEVFLPADVEPLDGSTFKNGLKDDEIGGYLREMEERGAAVWVIFDCCHSGTMTRGKAFREVPRSVRPQDLGISDKAVQEARRRAAEAVAKKKKVEATRSASTLESGALDNLGERKRKSKGSLVAFYAAQPFEETVETLRPDDAEERAENYYGLLSSAIVKVLGQSTGPMSYRDLSRKLLAFYTAERGARGPNPFIEGDVGMEVLGMKPAGAGLDIVLRRKKGGKLALSAGSLAGLTPGSVVSVHAPAGTKDDGKTALGFLRVVRSNPVEAEVAACVGPAEEPAVAEKTLPDLARCKIVSQDLGDMKLKFALRAASEKDQPDAEKLRKALEGMNKDIRALWTAVDKEGDADWILWVEKCKLRIRRGQGQRIDLQDDADVDKLAGAFGTPKNKQYGDYNLANLTEVVRKLERDLQTISTWQNLWRISGVSLSGAGSEDHGLKMEIELLGKGDKAIAPIETFPRLHVNQRLKITLKNDGYQNLWVTMLSLNGDCGISVFSFPLERGKTFAETGTLEKEAWGKEGILVFAVPQKEFKEAPAFGFLEQESLTKVRETSRSTSSIRGERERKIGDAPKTPFTELLRNASLGKGTARGFSPDVRTNPAILSQAWITLPTPAKK